MISSDMGIGRRSSTARFKASRVSDPRIKHSASSLFCVKSQSSAAFVTLGSLGRPHTASTISRSSYKSEHQRREHASVGFISMYLR